MSWDNAKNFAKATVSTGYNSAATSIVLSAGGGAVMPTAPFNATWWNSSDYGDPADDPSVEIVRVTAISTDTLTVTRGQEGIAATNKNTAGKVYKMVAPLTAKVLNTDLPPMLIAVTDSGTGSTVRCGSSNCASGNCSTAFGSCDTASACWTTVSGGYCNAASICYGTIGGGLCNKVCGHKYVTVSGGFANTASGAYATVSGGGCNTASGAYATIGGGCGNSASSYGLVAGGTGNHAIGTSSAIVGGGSNSAYGACTFLTGFGNSAHGTGSSIIGNNSTDCCHCYVTILGNAICADADCTTFVSSLCVKPNSGTLTIPTKTPASSSAAGVAGTIAWDSSFVYVATAANTWKRVALSSF